MHEEDSFDFVKEKKRKPHWTAWKCPECGEPLWDDGGNAFFECKDCGYSFFKHEIRKGIKDFGKNLPLQVDYDWEEEERKLNEAFSKYDNLDLSEEKKIMNEKRSMPHPKDKWRSW